MDRRRLLSFCLGALVIVALGSGCRPRVKAKPRGKRVPKETRTQVPVRPRVGLGERITDAQADDLLEGLLHEALGADDLATRVRKLSEPERRAALRAASRRPRSPRLDAAQRALENAPRTRSRTR